MIYKAGETITFVAFYTTDGLVKPSLSVSASVHRIGYGIVDNPDVSEDPDANGFYYCNYCLLYTSPSPRDLSTSRMPSSA